MLGRLLSTIMKRSGFVFLDITEMEGKKCLANREIMLGVAVTELDIQVDVPFGRYGATY